MRRAAVAGLALLLLTGACTAPSDVAEDPASPPTADGPGSTPAASSAVPVSPSASPAGPSTSPSPRASAPSPSPSPQRPSSPRPRPNPVSVQALIEKNYNGRDLEVGRLLDDTDAYRRYLVTYRSEDLTVSGVMNVPDGDGPFPVLVLAHGYIDPDVYVPGQGLRREQDYLAR